MFDTKSQLLRALDKLATYNDKGIGWSRHAPEEVEAERAIMMAKIESFVARVGESSLPPELIQGMRSGAVAVDGTGQFQSAVRRYFNG
jgi:hypothetical protein